MIRRAEVRASRAYRYGRTAMAALAVTGAASGIAACGGASTGSSGASGSGKVVDLTLWESHSGATNPVAVAEQHIVTMFNQSQKQVHVTILETKASTKALAAAQAGDPPVIAEIGHYDGQFRRNGLIVNQTPLMTGAGGFAASQLASFYTGVIINGRMPQQVTDGQPQPGKQYRLPADVKVSELFYNQALFQQAGISACPATWTQLGADLVKLKKLGVTPMGYKDSTAHILPPFISNGGALYSPGQRTTQFDSSAGVTTFQMFRNWYGKGLFVFSHGSDMRAAMANKKLAIEDGTSAGWVKARDEARAGGVTLGACPEPIGTSGHSGNLIQGLGFVIFSSASSAQQKAAFEFEKFWNTPAVQAYWAKASGFTPTVKSAVPLIGASYLSSPAGQGLKVSIAEIASPYSEPRGQSDTYAQVDSQLDSAFYNAVTGKESVAAALKGLDAADKRYLTGQTKI